MQALGREGARAAGSVAPVVIRTVGGVTVGVTRAGLGVAGHLMFRMTGTLEQSFKGALRRSKAGGVDRIARTADFTTKIRQAVVSQSRYHIEG
ncbi:hypothetical protein [Streptomyces durhamensis]|uniref:hypothetical protein n=1 Tax=Streptomyces durhamensis TaxID=68194 RepID=UPI001428B4BF|nr:hypothetical protein [Streptomyces durhamensis]